MTNGPIAGARGRWARLAGVILLATGGCAAAPAGPRGPLLGEGFEVATDWSYAHGQGQAVLPDGSSTSGGADNFWSPLTIFPRRLEARISPIPWMDIGGQLGWLGGGLDARVGLPATKSRAIAFNLAVGFESGQAGPFKDTRPTDSRWVRAEAYPALPSARGDLRLVLAVGLDVGTFYHELPDPRPTSQLDQGSDSLGPSSIQTLRHETRLETSAGVFFYRAASVLVTISPYIVLDAGRPQANCDGCDVLADYRQSWGIVVVTRFAGHFVF